MKPAAKKADPGLVRVGPAGWSYADWAGIVYPTRKPRDFHEAAYLAEYFDTIELTTSFYQPLLAQLCAQWLNRGFADTLPSHCTPRVTRSHNSNDAAIHLGTHPH